MSDDPNNGPNSEPIEAELLPVPRAAASSSPAPSSTPTSPSTPPARSPAATLLDLSSRDSDTWRLLEKDLGPDLVSEALAWDMASKAVNAQEGEEHLTKAASMLSRLQDPNWWHTPACPPDCKRHQLRFIARECGILLPELVEMVRNREVAIALLSSGMQTGRVLEGIVKLATEGQAVCTACFGEGEVLLLDKKGREQMDPDTEEMLRKTCPGCRGKGVVAIPPNLEAARIFLKVQGLDKSGAAGTTINLGVQQGVSVGKMGGGKSDTEQEHVTVRVERIISGG